MKLKEIKVKILIKKNNKDNNYTNLNKHFYQKIYYIHYNNNI